MNDLEQLLARDPPGIGDNFPPPESLGEQLAEETAALRARADELVLNLKERAVVATPDDAEKMTLLLAMVAEHSDTIEDARVERKYPFLENARIVDAHFADLQFPLVGAPRKKGGAYAEGHARLDAYRRRQEAAAAAERKRLEDAAHRQRLAAEAAERRARELEVIQRRATDEAAAEKARRQKVEAELAQRKAADAAALLDARAEAAEAPQVIHSGYGQKATRRTIYRVEIVDLSLALRHFLKVDQHKLRDAVQDFCDRQVRAGVRELPGCKIIEDSATVIRK